MNDLNYNLEPNNDIYLNLISSNNEQVILNDNLQVVSNVHQINSIPEDEIPSKFCPDVPLPLSYQIPKATCRLIFSLFFLLSIITNFEDGIISAATIVIKKELQINNYQLGCFSSSTYIGRLIGSILLYFTINKINKKILLIFCCIFKGIALCVVLTIRNYYLILTMRGMAGLCQIIFTIYPYVWCDRYGKRKKRTMMISLIQLGIPLGVAGGFDVCSYMNFKWKSCFVIEGSFLFFSSLVLMFISQKYLNITTSGDSKNVKILKKTSEKVLNITDDSIAKTILEQKANSNNISTISNNSSINNARNILKNLLDTNISTNQNSTNQKDNIIPPEGEIENQLELPKNIVNNSIIELLTKSPDNSPSISSSNNSLTLNEINQKNDQNDNNDLIKELNEDPLSLKESYSNDINLILDSKSSIYDHSSTLNLSSSSSITISTLSSFMLNPGTFPFLKFLKNIFHTKIFIFTTMSSSVMYFTMYFLMFWGPFYLENYYSMTRREQKTVTFSSVCLTAPSFGMVIGGVIGGCIDGYEKKKALIISLIFHCVACLCLVPTGLVNDTFTFVLCVWAFFFFVGVITPLHTGIILSSVPMEMRGNASILMKLIINFFGLIPSAVIFGLISNRYGVNKAMIVCSNCSFFGLLFISISVIFRFTIEKNQEGNRNAFTTYKSYSNDDLILIEQSFFKGQNSNDNGSNNSNN